MNDEQKASVEGWAIALGAFQAYLDYVLRYEINLILQSGRMADPDVDIEQISEELKTACMKHIAADISEYLPQVFGDLSVKLKEAVA